MKGVNINTNQFDAAWIGIVVALVIFWPIGLFLLFNKLKADRKASVKCHKLLMVVSFVLMGLGGIHFLRALIEWGTTGVLTDYIIFWAILTGGGGLVLYVVARRTRAIGEKYKQYIALIVSHSQSSIDNIASAMGVPYETAIDDLQKMIAAGFFPEAYVDYKKRELLFKISGSQSARDASANVQGVPQITIFNCQNCGANNTIGAGQLAECDYCGSPLSSL